MSAKSVHSIFSRDSFCLEEKKIFLAATKWCQANIYASKNDRDLVMSSVRLNQISQEYLLKEVWESKLFSSDHILGAIKNQTEKNVTNHRVQAHAVIPHHDINDWIGKTRVVYIGTVENGDKYK